MHVFLLLLTWSEFFLRLEKEVHVTPLNFSKKLVLFCIKKLRRGFEFRVRRKRKALDLGRTLVMEVGILFFLIYLI